MNKRYLTRQVCVLPQRPRAAGHQNTLQIRHGGRRPEYSTTKQARFTPELDGGRARLTASASRRAGLCDGSNNRRRAPGTPL
jgi:hypothetical protein